jgi:hypothetical protein
LQSLGILSWTTPSIHISLDLIFWKVLWAYLVQIAYATRRAPYRIRASEKNSKRKAIFVCSEIIYGPILSCFFPCKKIRWWNLLITVVLKNKTIILLLIKNMTTLYNHYDYCSTESVSFIMSILILNMINII